MASTLNRPPRETILDANTAAALLGRAREARRHAYAPYSGFTVGAALLTEDGQIVTGCNVENASFSLTNCAERVALQKAVSEGHRRFRAIAVIGPQDDLACMPCGSCRQALHEFGRAMLVVTAGVERGTPHTVSLQDLLPSAFERDRLSTGGSA